MTIPTPPPPLEAEAEQSGAFDRLRRFILYHLGGFTLGLVRVNDPSQRNGVIAVLADILAREGAQLIRVDLANRHPASLLEAIRGDANLHSLITNPQSKAALAIVGMEHLIETEPNDSGRPPFAAALNAERDTLRDALLLPLIIFLTDHAMDRLDLAAPDFFDWYSGIFHFYPSSLPQPELPKQLDGVEAWQATHLHEDIPPPSPLSPQALAERLELLENRRAELERAGPESRSRLAQVLREIGELYTNFPEFRDRQSAALYLKRAVEIFHEEGQQAEEAGALEQLGIVCHWIMDYKQAARRLEAALHLYHKIGQRIHEADCLSHLGELFLMHLEEPRQAYTCFEEALSICRELDNQKSEAECLERIGTIHLLRREYTEARTHLEEALSIYRKVGDQQGEATCLLRFGDINRRLGNFSQARASYEEALSVYREIADRDSEAMCLMSIGEMYGDLGEHSKAHARFEEALAITRKIGDRPSEAKYLERLGTWHEGVDEFIKARAYYEEALSIYREIRDLPSEANCIQKIGDVHMKLGEYSKARAHYDTALPLYRELSDRSGEATTYNSIAYIRILEGDLEGAIVTCSQAIAAEPKAIAPILNRANVLIALNRLDEARTDCETASRLAPDHTYTHGCWGDLHLARGEWAEAETRYRAIIAKDDSPSWRFDLAVALWGLGRVDEGRAEFEAALAKADADLRAETLRAYHRHLERHSSLPALAEAIERLAPPSSPPSS